MITSISMRVSGMSKSDYEKWNRKYQKNEKLLQRREPSSVILQYIPAVTTAKRALDIACGSGRNTLCLASMGYMVDAVDIALQPLQKLKEFANDDKVYDNINIYMADLDSFEIPDTTYSVVVMANYLDRDLITKTREYIEIGGYFVLDTYIDDIRNEKIDSNKGYLLKAEEVDSLFGDKFEIVYKSTYQNESYELYRMFKMAIVAKRTR